MSCLSFNWQTTTILALEYVTSCHCSIGLDIHHRMVFWYLISTMAVLFLHYYITISQQKKKLLDLHSFISLSLLSPSASLPFWLTHYRQNDYHPSLPAQNPIQPSQKSWRARTHVRWIQGTKRASAGHPASARASVLAGLCSGAPDTADQKSFCGFWWRTDHALW